MFFVKKKSFKCIVIFTIGGFSCSDSLSIAEKKDRKNKVQLQVLK